LRKVANGFSSSYVSDNQVGAIFGGTLCIKVGGAGGAWTAVANNAVAFAIT